MSLRLLPLISMLFFSFHTVIDTSFSFVYCHFRHYFSLRYCYFHYCHAITPLIRHVIDIAITPAFHWLAIITDTWCHAAIAHYACYGHVMHGHTLATLIADSWLRPFCPLIISYRFSPLIASHWPLATHFRRWLAIVYATHILRYYIDDVDAAGHRLSFSLAAIDITSLIRLLMLLRRHIDIISFIIDAHFAIISHW